jgi:branched-chain amino acid transport system permease protein
MHGVPRWVRTLWIAALLGVALILPWVLVPYELSKVATVLQISLAVLSMNLLVGLCGQISLGQSAFVGIGAYGTTILVTTYQWSMVAAGVAAVVVSALAGLLVGLPALRLRGLYLALTSLGIAIVFPTLIQSARELTGGTSGMGLGRPLFAPAGSGLDDTQFVYLVSLGITVAILVLVRNIKASRMGRALQAVRDREVVSEAFGVRVATTKLFCFMISAGIAGVSGFLFAIQHQFVAPEDFGLAASIDYFVGMAVGGQVSILGAVAGGAFLEYMPDVIESSGIDQVLTQLIYGVILIGVMLFFREGLAGGATAVVSRLSRRLGYRPELPRKGDVTGAANPSVDGDPASDLAPTPARAPDGDPVHDRG